MEKSRIFTTWESRAWETSKPDTSYINEDSFSSEKSDDLTKLDSKNYLKQRLCISDINTSNQYERANRSPYSRKL